MTFLFYGRPSYRVKKGANERLSYDWPIVLILDEKRIADLIYRIYPFDTGGFFIKKYEAFFDKGCKISDFEINSSDEESLRRIVGAFYQSNYEYFTGSSRKNVDIAIDEFEAGGLHEMARAPANPLTRSRFSSDERSSSIEIQIKKKITLKDSIIGIILPEKYLDVKNWVQSIDRWNVKKVYTYPIVNSVNPEFFAGVVYSKTEGLLKELGYLS